MNTLKQLTYDDVKKTFLKLLEENGETTSLDVKNELRKKFFHAKQHYISEIIVQVTNSLSITWDYNGTYRTYYKTKTAVPVYSPNKKNKPVLSDSDRKPILNPIDGSWKCIADIYNRDHPSSEELRNWLKEMEK